MSLFIQLFFHVCFCTCFPLFVWHLHLLKNIENYLTQPGICVFIFWLLKLEISSLQDCSWGSWSGWRASVGSTCLTLPLQNSWKTQGWSNLGWSVVFLWSVQKTWHTESKWTEPLAGNEEQNKRDKGRRFILCIKVGNLCTRAQCSWGYRSTKRKRAAFLRPGDVSWWQGIRGRKEFSYRGVFSVKERVNGCPANRV